MKTLSGTGLVILNGSERPVSYDLVRTDPGGAVEGQLFGDPDVIHDAFAAATVKLRLEDGGWIKLMLLNCETHGVAAVRAVGRTPCEMGEDGLEGQPAPSAGLV